MSYGLSKFDPSFCPRTYHVKPPAKAPAPAPKALDTMEKKKPLAPEGTLAPTKLPK